MILTDLIKEQVFQCIIMFAAGILVTILYQIFNIVRSIIDPGKVMSAVMEMGFWIAAAVVTVRFLYYCAYGGLSVHSALAFGAGVILWKIFFYDIINRIYINLKKWNEIRKTNGEKET